MIFQDIDEKFQSEYNASVNHPLQSFEWGEFRKKTNIKIIRRASQENKKISHAYQISVHKTPNFPYQIGYFPKGVLPDEIITNELTEIGEKKSISFIQLEPDEYKNQNIILPSNLKRSFHPLFTRYTFVLDLTKSEDEILKNMHQKTRYNVRLSEKKGVKTNIDNSDDSFKAYLKLTKETTNRQKFYAHDEKYHRLMWEALHAPTIEQSNNQTIDFNKLQAHLLKAEYNKKTLVTYILFTFKDKLYYPYGASSNEHREVMASQAAMWGAIKFGKELGLKTFDMWGAANVEDPNKNDPYYGFHRFKEGFGAQLTEFIGSYDLIINPINYRLLTVADKIRWAYLRAKKIK